MKLKDYRIISPIEIEKLETHKEVDDAVKKLKKTRKKIGKLQNTMYAEGKYSILLCIQGMDTSGKDSLIREVFKEVNVRGVEVSSFKTPTEMELKHDFMWRHYIALPPKGKIGVFNRTHYENVLVTRVHPEYILSENIPTINEVSDLDDDFYYSRMERINQFEEHLTKNGTIVLKIFLHLSKEEQKNRLLRRLNIPDKNWKFSADDLKERKHWEVYQKYYQDVLNRTSTNHAPWYVIPADDKPTARYLVSKILLKQMKKYNFQEPVLQGQFLEKIEVFKEGLHNN